MVDTVGPELLLEHRLLLLREPLWGMGIILILDVVVLDYIFITFKKDKLAAACFIPYILWLLWATYLNAYIYIFN